MSNERPELLDAEIGRAAAMAAYDDVAAGVCGPGLSDEGFAGTAAEEAVDTAAIECMGAFGNDGALSSLKTSSKISSNNSS